MLLVVVAHAALAYAEVRIPGLLWAVRDPSRSPVFDALFWASVGAAMPAFFTLSGFFAVKILDARGAAGFARNRARRILVPFLAAALTVLPMTLAVWGAGWLSRGRCTWGQLLRMKFLDPIIKANLIGPAHLWYLEYLLLMLAVLGLWRGLRSPAGAGVRRGWLLHPMAPLVLAIPTALILWTGHRRLGLDAVSDLRNSFLPDPFRWAHHAWFFLVGTWLSRHHDGLDALVSHWTWRLGLSVPVFLVRFWLLERDLAAPLHGAESVALAASGALFGWLALFGSLGLFQAALGRPRASVCYLADSSYWIYLIHLPLVGLVQVDLSRSPGGCAWKFAAVLGVSLALGLASYETVVRRTWLGRWLHGPRPLPLRVARFDRRVGLPVQAAGITMTGR